MPVELELPTFRQKSRTLGLMIALQFAGYFILFVLLHAFKNAQGDYLNNPGRVPTGWFGVGTAYADWASNLHSLQRFLNSSGGQKSLMCSAFVLVTGGYLGALRAVKRSAVKLQTRSIVLLTILLALPMLLLPQLLSADIWSYVVYGRIAAVHGGNPLIDTPAMYPHDPFLARVFWKNTPSVYGPTWVLVSIALTRLAEFLGGAAAAYVIVFKLFIVLTHLLNTLLIGRILRVIRPGHQTLGALLYAWNPLCVIEFCGSAHNDCFMLTLLLIGILCASNERSKSAVGWMVVAGLAKLSGALGLPAYTLWLARRTPERSIRIVITQGVIAVIVVALLYLPFWRGAATLHGTTNAPNFRLMWHSLPSAVDNVLENKFAHEKVPQHGFDYVPPAGSKAARIRSGVRTVSMLCFALCFIPLSIRKVNDIDDWLDRITAIFAAYLLFAAFTFNPWYATWLVPMAALVKKPSWLLIAMSLMSLAFYLPFAAKGLALAYLWPLYGLFFCMILPTALGRQAKLCQSRTSL